MVTTIHRLRERKPGMKSDKCSKRGDDPTPAYFSTKHLPAAHVRHRRFSKRLRAPAVNLRRKSPRQIFPQSGCGRGGGGGGEDRQNAGEERKLIGTIVKQDRFKHMAWCHPSTSSRSAPEDQQVCCSTEACYRSQSRWPSHALCHSHSVESCGSDQGLSL
jgi:hypothetical protein